MQAAGAEEVGGAEQTQANYQAQVAKVNAQIAGENATYAMAAGQEEAGIVGLQGAGQVGEIKAAQGASNIDVNTGSAEKVQESARAQNELSSEDILNNAVANRLWLSGSANERDSASRSLRIGRATSPDCRRYQSRRGKRKRRI